MYIRANAIVKCWDSIVPNDGFFYTSQKRGENLADILTRMLWSSSGWR